MNKIVFPALLVATVMIAGAFAFVPVEQASTVHTSGTVTANAVTGSTEAVTANGASVISLTTATTDWTTTGASTATLADGGAGQIKVLTLSVDGGQNQVVTVANDQAGTNTWLFADAGDLMVTVFVPGVGWTIVVNIGVALSEV